MRLLSLLLVTLVAACTIGVEGVNQHHVNHAQKLCTANDGLLNIVGALSVGEVESCGYRCTRPTGRTTYSAKISCRNGATFDLHVTE